MQCRHVHIDAEFPGTGADVEGDDVVVNPTEPPTAPSSPISAKVTRDMGPPETAPDDNGEEGPPELVLAAINCSTVAHCSDRAQSLAFPSSLLLTASSNGPMHS